jgi:hypothetical protein
LLITTSSGFLYVSEPENQQLHFLEKLNQRTAGRYYKNLKQLGGYKGGYLVFSKKIEEPWLYI